uniref:Protein FYV4, mitochondrial n=1 Tax=Neobodo designis TaxID=312471 RepID=A0A7S1M2Y0_NEODS|mmetsp:Transcript_33314/g.102890  ORF Transcript_33314/g.102890 Transcript_33314/m.102890 type:complete len:189 (+) Transcript_33314:38-604(+)|eukprot:CAMPEP_0174847186 /NCGR_PEP_ID=MMETSP1114-20130205/12758_1 /TAXON_ID=312471 /ORGANISM="Neobodo designis, Strain CCAP 1951/1" /LENGTH=188 /DNA_ID=CAMNT_0016081457 /DNA_START=37 /DNA_END=603 /DNA_ORIENTATION=-
MLRRSLCRRDQTRQPMKSFQYGYQPDPRKLAPMRSISTEELHPKVHRPPTRAVPDQATFLQALDVNKRFPIADHAGSFETWEELNDPPQQTLADRGVPNRVINHVRNRMELYKNGLMPNAYDRKEEQSYWDTFGNTQHRVVPELPEKYRPHQLGEEQRGTPDFGRLSKQPEWALAEEKRLAEKAEGSS